MQLLTHGRAPENPFILKIINVWQRNKNNSKQGKILNYKVFTLIDNIFNADDIKQIKAWFMILESVNYKRDILGQFADPISLYRVNYNILNSKY